MLKILIVDDEEAIREGLKTIIKWEDRGFYICGEASNGIDGLAKCSELLPDLIIADIKMPGIDGLQMIEELRTRSMKSKVILLTGYSEFLYAKKALELGASSYLLKPIDEDELIKSITLVSAEIDKNRKLDNNIKLSADKILEKLICGGIDSETVSCCNELLGMGIPWASYQVILVDVEKPRDMYRKNVRDEAGEIIRLFINEHGYGHVCELEGNIAVLVKNTFFDRQNLLPLQKLCEELNQKLSVDITIAIGGCVKDINDISYSYKQAFNLLKRKFIYEYHYILLAPLDETRGIQSSHISSFNQFVDKLYIAVDTNSSQSINNLLEEFRIEIEDSDWEEEKIKLTYMRLYIQVMNKLNVSNERQVSSEQEGSITDEINETKSLKKLHGLLKYKFTALSDELAQTRPGSTMKKILDYIDRNYSSDIKLCVLSEVFNYNSNYLGKAFKEYTGEQFNTYLDKIRIEKAKQLLRQGIKVNQVAQMVGYNDVDYFHNKFKKHVLMSPTKYKDSAT